MPGFWKKAMVYLGLVDEEYDQYDDFEPRAPIARAGALRPRDIENEDPMPPPAPSVRPVVAASAGGGAPVITPRSVVRPVSSEASSSVHVVAPTQFADARQIADRLMGSQPVIVNLQLSDAALMRRMIDFCSGVAYALSGKMERVADRVFLITPSNVKVSAEERQRLQENGLLRSS